MLQIEFIQILSWHVKVVQSQDLLVSDFDLFSKRPGNIDFMLKSSLHLMESDVHLLTSLIGTPSLSSPLSPFIQSSLLLANTHIYSYIVLIPLLKASHYFHCLLVTLDHVISRLAI